LVVIRPVADRQVIVAASKSALRCGIRSGMTLTQARALFAGVLHAEHQPPRDRRALEALGRWMTRFTPAVTLGCDTGVPPVRGAAADGRSPTSQHNSHGRDARLTVGLFLDVTGGEHLFGGIESLVRQVRESLARMRVDARVAAAPTPGAAWALAFGGAGDGMVVSEDELESALAPLPPVALRIDDELAESLHHLGLSTIGQVMALPREVLPARFGTALSLRLDQALGRVDEPLVPLEYQPPLEARMDFDGVVSALEAVWAVFRELVGRVIGQLARMGRGARRVEVEFFRDGLPPVRRSILLSRASRDPVNLFNLFRCAAEDLVAPQQPRSRLRGRRPGQQVAPTRVEQLQSDGFVGMRLTVPLHEPLGDEQVRLLGHEDYAGQLELDRLIERLRVRLGEEAVVRAELVEAYVPERAWRVGEIVEEEDRGWRIEDRKGKDRPPLPSIFYPPSSSSSRPLHLLPRPEEIRVMVSPSDDREGRPVMFAHDGTVRRAVHCVGPERIAGQWWDGHDKTRDYFDVQDEQGRRFWVFRVAETGKWYLHGSW
jgi:protein ImuB